MVYKKPEMKFVELRNTRAIAAPCYPGNQGSTTHYWYDTATGYVSFNLPKGGCKGGVLTPTNVTYYLAGKNVTDTLSQAVKDAMYQELLDEVLSHQSENPFKGADALFPDNPGTGWS